LPSFRALEPAQVAVAAAAEAAAVPDMLPSPRPLTHPGTSAFPEAVAAKAAEAAAVQPLLHRTCRER
jgi:hypothetical protein